MTRSRWEAGPQSGRTRRSGHRARHSSGRRPLLGEVSDHLDVRCLHALGAALCIEGDLLVLFEAAVSAAVDRAEVREQVGRAVIGSDEAEALVGVEPFDDASGHDVIPYLSGTTGVIRVTAATSPPRGMVSAGYGQAGVGDRSLSPQDARRWKTMW